MSYKNLVEIVNIEILKLEKDFEKKYDHYLLEGEEISFHQICLTLVMRINKHFKYSPLLELCDFEIPSNIKTKVNLESLSFTDKNETINFKNKVIPYVTSEINGNNYNFILQIDTKSVDEYTHKFLKRNNIKFLPTIYEPNSFMFSYNINIENLLNKIK